jgi:hypothetical protein
MQVTRGPQSATHRQWSVTSDGRAYRAVCYWCGGQQRMTWLVEVYVCVRQGTNYWRRVDGREVINEIREFENNFARLSA